MSILHPRISTGTGKKTQEKKTHKKKHKIAYEKKNTGKKHNLFHTRVRKVVSFLYLNSKNYSKQISGLTTECVLFKYIS